MAGRLNVKSGDRERFLQFCGRVNTVEEGGILLFYTPTGANVLAGSKALFADGTFATCPPLFAQTYMVFGQLPNNGKVEPCAYALAGSNALFADGTFATCPPTTQ